MPLPMPHVAHFSRRSAVPGLLIALLAGACGGRDLLESPAGAEVRMHLELSAPAASAGDTIAVRVVAEADAGNPVAALQARLRFPPRRWRYVGQPVTDHLVMVNHEAADAGILRFSAVEARGLPRPAAELHFVALAPGSPADFVLAPEEADLRDLTILAGGAVRVGGPVAGAPRAPGPVAKLDAAAWIALLEPGYARGPIVAALPGEGAIYGDANLSGTVTSGDLVVVANVAVGNLELLTTLNRDLAIAGNVAPANLPGLGEPDDPVPPGEAADGSRSITAADQLLVSNFLVGNLPPVVGRPIPGRGTPSSGLPRVILDADTLRANRTFRRDTVYEIRGSLVVGDDPGPTTIPDITLTIEAGTRLEFDPATNGRLIVRTGANLVAVGTRLQPIVMRCASTAAFPGCWGGVHINGFALLNNSEQIGSPLKTGRGGTGTYGGILNADSSGALRYVRIEYAGRPTATNDTLGALQLLGVGSATRLEYVQVHAALGDGLFVSGGRPQLRYVLLSDGRGPAVRWDDGWVGKAQFVIVQQGAGSGDAFLGSNYAPNPVTGPRSAPRFSHVTVVGPGPVNAQTRTIRLRNGSGGVFLNLLAQRASGVGFDVEGQASCDFLAAYPDSLGVAAAIQFENGAPWATDDDCLDEVAFGEDPARRNRVADPQLNGAFVSLSPDFRPLDGSAPTSGDSLPPDDGFFDRAARYIGAVAPANLQRNNLPWYAGWTVGF